MKIVNTPIRKVDSKMITLGKALYTDDIKLNNPLVVKILRSTHPFAKIIKVNKEKAKEIHGVEGIYTHEDVPETYFTPAGQSYPEPSPYDTKILNEYVRYVGDAVAIIAAVDEKTALKAMKLIEVEYEILTPIIDYEKALDNKIIIHEKEAKCNFDIGYDNKRNLASKIFLEKDGVDKGIEESEIVLERTYRTQPQIHAMMETQRAQCYIDENDRLVVISSTQIPFHVRRHLARALEISPSKIRVIKPRIGGGFGAKQTMSMEMYPAFVTLKTGKPSKCVFTRKESFVCTTTRHAMTLRVKIGADSDGNIKGIDIKGIANTGAYGTHSPTVPGLVAFKTFPLYNKVPMRYECNVVYSNTMQGGAFRGYGATQGCFVVESIISELAKEIQKDSIEIKMKNLVDIKDNIFSGDIKKCVELGKKEFNWEEKKNSRELPNGKIRAAGMAVTMQGSGIAGVDTAAVSIKLNEVGHFTLNVGATDMGQGSDTVLTQIAAETLDIPMEKIIIKSADTDLSPYDPGAYASSGTYVTGNAVILACEKMKEEILKEGSYQLGLEKETLQYNCGDVISSCGKKLTLDELSNKAVSFERQNQIITTATYGSPTSPPPFIASFAEVEIDKFTGEVKVIDFLSVVDCGTLINPNLAKVQVEGGIAQGIGLALYEEILYQKNGKVINDEFMQYNIPARKEIGTSVKVIFNESYESTGPFGAKSVGEVVINTPAPAITDAIDRAIGLRVRTLPVRSEDILMYLTEKESKTIKNGAL